MKDMAQAKHKHAAKKRGGGGLDMIREMPSFKGNEDLCCLMETMSMDSADNA
jgi:hypothetical protein